jgi:hypothetical protein
MHAFATTPFAMADVLSSYVEHAGMPVVDLALRCDVHPARVMASLRAPRIAVPLCLRYAGTGGPSETCGVIGPAAQTGELVLTEAPGCPAWVIGNADGAGYYAAQWEHVGVGPIAPLAMQSPAERIAAGDDRASAVARGDLPVTAALAELTRLTASRDPYATLAALAIARALAPLVPPDDARRWWTYLAAQLADRLTPDAMIAPATPAWRAVRDRILEVLPGDRLPAATIKRARADFDKALAGGASASFAAVAAIAGATEDPDSHGRYTRLLELAAHAVDSDLRDAFYEAAGEFGPGELPDAIATVVQRGDSAWSVLHGYLDRPLTAAAAWSAVLERPEIIAALTPAHLAELAATIGNLCDAPLAAKAAALVHDAKLVAKPLAIVERCVTRRARAGMSAALRP